MSLLFLSFLPKYSLVSAFTYVDLLCEHHLTDLLRNVVSPNPNDSLITRAGQKMGRTGGCHKFVLGRAALLGAMWGAQACGSNYPCPSRYHRCACSFSRLALDPAAEAFWLFPSPVRLRSEAKTKTVISQQMRLNKSMKEKKICRQLPQDTRLSNSKGFGSISIPFSCHRLQYKSQGMSTLPWRQASMQ